MDQSAFSAAQPHLSPAAYANVESWYQKYPEFQQAIAQLATDSNWNVLEDAFYTRIRVGTGGIRGTVAVGPNRINARTIAEAAQALSQFILDFGPEAAAKGVVIGREVRLQSQQFVDICCEVFAANGIRSFVFDDIRTTPETSFAVRYLGTVAGVQITASHNPRTDNGFKFYWTDGGQVVAPLDVKFMELVTNVTDIKYMSLAEAKQQGLVKVLDKEVDETYIASICELSLVPTRSATITYSPIHGAGIKNVLPVLEKDGFKPIPVPEQIEPDENFPTAVGNLINPEFTEVMALAIKHGEENGSDLVLMSDPDADRIGVAAKAVLDSARLQHLSGNEIGIALTYFILSQLKSQQKLPEHGLVIETSVTTELIAVIARSFGLEAIDDLLVGFKFIGEIIEKLPDKNSFVFAAEESLGYLRGTFVRDKDAAITALHVAEMTSWLKDQGKTIPQYIDKIYRQYGYAKNILHYIELRGGRVDKERIASILKGLRRDGIAELAGRPVIETQDRLDEAKRNPETYVPGWTGDQITYYLSQDHWTKVVVRPSGTEPAAKVYIQHYAPVGSEDLESVKTRVDAMASDLEKAIIGICDKYIAEVHD